jgi:hypothetical protein
MPLFTYPKPLHHTLPMARLIIHGGARLSGTHRTPGNKNAALPMLTAALLTDEPVILENLPLIQDVRTTLEQLGRLGVEIDLDEAGRTVRLRARDIRKTRLDKALSSRVRSAILFAGPLLARCGAATICQPGGDLIGRRRVDTHISGLRALGAGFSLRNGYAFRCRELVGTDILLDEQSVTATENLVMDFDRITGLTGFFWMAARGRMKLRISRISRIGMVCLRLGGRVRGASLEQVRDAPLSRELCRELCRNPWTSRRSSLPPIPRHFARGQAPLPAAAVSEKAPTTRPIPA